MVTYVNGRKAGESGEDNGQIVVVGSVITGSVIQASGTAVVWDGEDEDGQ